MSIRQGYAEFISKAKYSKEDCVPKETFLQNIVLEKIAATPPPFLFVPLQCEKEKSSTLCYQICQAKSQEKVYNLTV